MFRYNKGSSESAAGSVRDGGTGQDREGRDQRMQVCVQNWGFPENEKRGLWWALDRGRTQCLKPLCGHWEGKRGPESKMGCGEGEEGLL